MTLILLNHLHDGSTSHIRHINWKIRHLTSRHTHCSLFLVSNKVDDTIDHNTAFDSYSSFVHRYHLQRKLIGCHQKVRNEFPYLRYLHDSGSVNILQSYHDGAMRLYRMRKLFTVQQQVWHVSDSVLQQYFRIRSTDDCSARYFTLC